MFDMKQFLGPGGEKEAKVKVREANRESLKRVELREKLVASGLALGILGMMNLGGPVFPGRGGSTPWCVGDPILHVASG